MGAGDGGWRLTPYYSVATTVVPEGRPRRGNSEVLWTDRTAVLGTEALKLVHSSLNGVYRRGKSQGSLILGFSIISA